MEIDIVTLRGWIGRKEIGSEVLDPVPGLLLAATLDAPDTDFREGMSLPRLRDFGTSHFAPNDRCSTVRRFSCAPNLQPID
jgi:hypothetical protein